MVQDCIAVQRTAYTGTLNLPLSLKFDHSDIWNLYSSRHCHNIITRFVLGVPYCRQTANL